jgi:hypothetical protein
MTSGRKREIKANTNEEGTMENSIHFSDLSEASYSLGIHSQ